MPKIDAAHWLKLINIALPDLRKYARGFAAAEFEKPPKDLGQAEIREYLLENHEYDAADIASIVNTINQYNRGELEV
jgi:hypothetical protein